MSRKLERMSSMDARSPRAPKLEFKEAAKSNIEKLTEKQRDLLFQRVGKSILDAMKAELRKASGAKEVAEDFVAELQQHVGGTCAAFPQPRPSYRCLLARI